MKNVLVKLGFCFLLVSSALTTLNAQLKDARLDGSWVLEDLKLQQLAADGTVIGTKAVVLNDTTQLKAANAFVFLYIFDNNVGVKAARGEQKAPINDKGTYTIENGQLVITIGYAEPVTYRFVYSVDGQKLNLVQVADAGATKKYIAVFKKEN